MINRNEIRLRSETGDKYIRHTISGHLLVLRGMSVCDLVGCRKKRNLVDKGVETVVGKLVF